MSTKTSKNAWAERQSARCCHLHSSKVFAAFTFSKLLFSFTKGDFFRFRLLESVSLLNKRFYLAPEPIKLLLVVIMRYHLSIFFSNQSLNALPLLKGSVKHARR